MEEYSEVETKLLLSQLREGNTCAFERLYQMHSKALLSNIRHLVKNKEIASEILQDVYLKIWEGRASIDPDKSYKSFLYTIARNLVYDHFRRVALDERRRSELIRTAVQLYNHVEEQLIGKESQVLLNDAVAQLPLQCRTVYTLSRLEGKSHQEISQLLNISPATVNNHIVKANREIRSFLLRHGELALIIALITLCNH
jgi:RNA polymerase sigma-70 factor (ECF subfamily)